MVLTLNRFLTGDAGMYDTIHEYVGDIGYIVLSGSRFPGRILHPQGRTYDMQNLRPGLGQIENTRIHPSLITIAGTDGGAVIARARQGGPNQRIDEYHALPDPTEHGLVGEAPTSWIPGRETNLWRRSLRVGT